MSSQGIWDDDNHDWAIRINGKTTEGLTYKEARALAGPATVPPFDEVAIYNQQKVMSEDARKWAQPWKNQ